MGFTEFCGVFCNEELEGGKFHGSWDMFLNELGICVIVSVLMIFTSS